MSVRLALVAASIPVLLVLPGCGEAPPRAPQSTQTVAAKPGVPGGVVTNRTDLTARVTFKDSGKRQMTLLNADGQQKVFDVPKEVVNFDQINAGDLVVMIITEQIAIAVVDASTTVEQGETAVIARAEQGQKPAGAIVSVTQVRGKVTALDLDKRIATIAIDGGPVKVVPVRGDIDLTQRKVGDQVVMRMTEAFEIRVDKKTDQ